VASLMTTRAIRGAAHDSKTVSGLTVSVGVARTVVTPAMDLNSEIAELDNRATSSVIFS
jgi:hypothetical protein